MKKKTSISAEGKHLKSKGGKATTITALLAALMAVGNMGISKFLQQPPKLARTHAPTHAAMPAPQDAQQRNEHGSVDDITMDDVMDFTEAHPDILLAIVEICTRHHDCCDDQIVSHVIRFSIMYLVALRSGDSEIEALQKAMKYLSLIHVEAEKDKGPEPFAPEAAI